MELIIVYLSWQQPLNIDLIFCVGIVIFAVVMHKLAKENDSNKKNKE